MWCIFSQTSILAKKTASFLTVWEKKERNNKNGEENSIIFKQTINRQWAGQRLDDAEIPRIQAAEPVQDLGEGVKESSGLFVGEVVRRQCCQAFWCIIHAV